MKFLLAAQSCPTVTVRPTVQRNILTFTIILSLLKHPSYIKDTYDFINKIKEFPLPPDSFLFTMDIDSLYTNTDTSQGIQAIKNIFAKYPDSKRPDKELLELLHINLTNFEFNNKYFI